MRTFPEKYQCSSPVQARVASIRTFPPSYDPNPTPRGVQPTTRSNHIHNVRSGPVVTPRRPASRINDGYEHLLSGGGDASANRGIRTRIPMEESPSPKVIRATGSDGYTSVSRDYLLMV